MQVLSPSTPLVLTFRLLNLLAFYTSTLANLLPPSSALLPEPSTPSSSSPAHLIDVLSETKAHCQRMFEAGLRSYGEALLASPPAYSMDLSVRAHLFYRQWTGLGSCVQRVFVCAVACRPSPSPRMRAGSCPKSCR